jgi:hypothetical protein
VTTIPNSPAARYRAVVVRVAAIDAEEGRLREHERLRQEHLDRTEPELHEALQAVRDAEERLARARSAHGSAGLSDLASVTRQGRLDRERDELLAERDDLAPWAPKGASA